MKSFRLSLLVLGLAFLTTTPTASMGEEPVKAFLLRPWVPPDEGLAAVIVGETTIMVAQSLFVATGLTLAWFLLPLSSAFLKGMMWLLVVEVLALGGFALVQLLGVFDRGLRFLTSLGLRWEGPLAAKIRRLDRALAAFYREHPKRLGLSLFFHFLGWLLGSLEAYPILYFLDIPISLATARHRGLRLGNQVHGVYDPGGLGVREGGNMAAFTAFGLGAGVGLSYTLIRRLRELAWIAVGRTMLPLLQPSSSGART